MPNAVYGFVPIPFDSFRSKLDHLYGSGRHAGGTLTRVRKVCRELAELGAVTTADLTTELMARYVASKGPGANPNTVNGLLSTASALCSYAAEEGWLARPPAMRRVRPRPRRMSRNAPPRYEAVGRLLAHTRAAADAGGWEDRRLDALVWTFALTALRLREALYLQVGDLDLAGDRPKLLVSPRRRLKTEASAAEVPIPDALAQVLRGWLPHAGPLWVFPGVRRRGPWTGGTVGARSIDALKRAAAAVGIDRITWHSLRHAYGTYATERWGLPVWVVQRVMRHTDARTTEGYLHLDGSPRVAESVRGIAYRVPA